MNKIALFLKRPITFKKGITIYPPSVNDVVDEELFTVFEKILCMTQEEIEDAFFEEKVEVEQCPTPFEFLFANSYNNREYEKLAKAAFSFFIKEPVSFLYDCKTILIGDVEKLLAESVPIEKMTFLTEDSFFDFQNLIRQACGSKIVDKPIENEHPKVREMKRKARYRDRIKAKNGNGIDLFSSLVSICCMGIGITPLNIGEMSYASVSILTNKYQDKEKYELDIRSLLAGADSKKVKPEYWISKIKE